MRSHEESGEARQELESLSNPTMTRSLEHMDGDTITNGIGDLGLRPVSISEQSALCQAPLDQGLMANRKSINITPPNSCPADERTHSMLVDAVSGIFSHQQPLETGLHTMHAGEYDGAQENIGTDLWNTQLDIGSSPFFAGEDFDLDAMNLSILQATSQSFHAMESTSRQGTTDQLEPLNFLPEGQYRGKPSSHVQRRWHTFSEHTPSGDATPTDTQERLGLNDDHRQRLVESLGQRVQHGILPSTSFLVRFIHRSGFNLNIYTNFLLCLEFMYSGLLLSFPACFPYDTCINFSASQTKLCTPSLNLFNRKSISLLSTGHFPQHKPI